LRHKFGGVVHIEKVDIAKAAFHQSQGDQDSQGHFDLFSFAKLKPVKDVLNQIRHQSVARRQHHARDGDIGQTFAELQQLEQDSFDFWR
jgi:hypothetical protein